MRIVIDAGHGFKTAGKRTPDGMREWEFNSAVANEMKELLSQYEGVETQFVHDVSGNTDVSLANRVSLANKYKANAFVSIHANAYGNEWNEANGIETFVYKKTYTDALNLAATVQTKLIRATGLRNRGVKEADFYVLKGTAMTAILVECGFMTNRDEARLLKSDAYRKKCAAAIVDGLAEHYKLKLKNPKPPTPIALTTSPKYFRIMTGTFTKKEDAEKVLQEIKKLVKIAYLKEE